MNKMILALVCITISNLSVLAAEKTQENAFRKHKVQAFLNSNLSAPLLQEQTQTTANQQEEAKKVAQDTEETIVTQELNQLTAALALASEKQKANRWAQPSPAPTMTGKQSTSDSAVHKQSKPIPNSYYRKKTADTFMLTVEDCD